MRFPRRQDAVDHRMHPALPKKWPDVLMDWRVRMRLRCEWLEDPLELFRSPALEFRTSFQTDLLRPHWDEAGL